MTRTTLCLFLFCAMFLIGAISAAKTYRIVIKDDAPWATISTSGICKDEQEFTEVYTLKRQKLAYFSAGDGFDGSKCKSDLLATVTGARAATTITEAEAACATACGGTTCLCEGGQTCKTGIESCIKYFSCDATSTTCISIKGHYGRFDIDISGTDDATANLLKLNKARDFLLTFGKSQFCWTTTTYVYSIPSNNRNTRLQVFILDNDTTKTGCTRDFDIPAEKWPQDIASPSVSYHESYDADLGQCLDYTTGQIICGSTCNAGCAENAICVSNSDCVFGSCSSVSDIDGHSLDEKRCSNAVHASVAVAIFAAFLALLF